MANDERERALAAFDARGTSNGGKPCWDSFRAGYDASRARAEQLERELAHCKEAAQKWGDLADERQRELASLRRDYQTSLALEQGLHERAQRAETELAAERARADAMAAVIEVSEPEEERLRSELAAERERVKEAAEMRAHLEKEIRAHRQAHQETGREMAAEVAYLETALAAERAELKRCRELLERCRSRIDAMMGDTDLDDDDSPEMRLMQDLNLALSAAPPAAPPAEVPDHPVNQDCVMLGCPGVHVEPDPGPSRQRIDKLGLESEREGERLRGENLALRRLLERAQKQRWIPEETLLGEDIARALAPSTGRDT